MQAFSTDMAVKGYAREFGNLEIRVCKHRGFQGRTPSYTSEWFQGIHKVLISKR